MFSKQGPLAGILAGLEATQADWLGVQAVDCPLFPPELFHHALRSETGAAEVIVFQDSQANPHWLLGLYKQELRLRIRESLQRGCRAVKRFAENIEVAVLKLPNPYDDLVFTNLNTPSDLSKAGYRIP
jgi:molybdopterin-guanine dinucleotide biosynthesis protein A